MEEDCRATRCKRKASIGHMPPRKRRRGDGEPAAGVAAEAVTAKGAERKASTETQRFHSQKLLDAGGPTEVSQRQEGGGAGQQPAAGPTRMKRRRSCSQPSASTENFLSVETSRANFEAEHNQLSKLGEGGFGSVYAGFRRADNLPVAIRRVCHNNVMSKPVDFNGQICMVPMEVLLMQRAAGGPESVGRSAAVSLLDWYKLDKEVLLVMERPEPCLDLLTYLNDRPLEEAKAKDIMVEASIKMHSDGVFHRDIKSENVLVETDHDVPRVRLIDFGCGCFLRERHHNFTGTDAYMPPEFFLRGTYQAGPTTAWQLGTLLYEMLTGSMQFRISQYLLSIPKFLMELRQLDLTYDCQNLLKMCFTLDPQKRVTLEQMLLHPWFNNPANPAPAHPRSLALRQEFI